MRTRTFFVSLVVHVLMIAALIIVPIVATGDLPEPRQSTTFIAVTPEVPAVPAPPVVRRPPSPGPAANPNAAPVVEPPAIGVERPFEPIDAPIPDGLLPGSGDVGGTIVDPSVVGPPPPAPSPAPVAPVRIGGGIRPPQKIQHVAPEYPAIARSARVAGIVILEAVLGEDGSVRDVKVLRSIPLLDKAAVDAVRQWRFTPTLLNGEPVPVVMTITVAFNLQ